MTEDAPRRSNPWPFVAISILVLLLAAFLYLRLSRKEARPAPVDTTRKTPDSQPDRKTPVLDEKENERRILVDQAKTALKEGRLEDAAEALAKAKEIRPADDLDEVSKGVETERKKIQEAQERDREMAIAIEKLSASWHDQWKKEQHWDQAWAAVGELLKRYPEVEKDTAFERIRNDVATSRSESAKVYQSFVDDAKRLQEKGEIAAALEKLQRALLYYPERADDVAKLRGAWETAIQDKDMVRIADLEAIVGDDAIEDERPKRKYTGKAFRIDRYEVTNEEYAAFLAAVPDHPAPKHWKGRRVPGNMAKIPVAGVSLLDAEAFAKWARKRLPTADEWEKAARFLDGRTYPWGDEFTPPGSGEFYANSYEYWQHHKEKAVPFPLPVGSFPNGKSGFEVYDMAGNVWEWTSTRVTVERDGQKVEMAVLKGGSYLTSKEALRCSNRLVDEIEFDHVDYGFRCVRD